MFIKLQNQISIFDFFFYKTKNLFIQPTILRLSPRNEPSSQTFQSFVCNFFVTIICKQTSELDFLRDNRSLGIFRFAIRFFLNSCFCVGFFDSHRWWLDFSTALSSPTMTLEQHLRQSTSTLFFNQSNFRWIKIQSYQSTEHLFTNCENKKGWVASTTLLW